MKDDLLSHSREVASKLQEAFTPIVEATAGSPPRPATLVRRLGIDKTLAARVLRAVKAKNALTVLREIPSPNGLRKFIDAARGAGPECLAYQEALQATAAFEVFLADFPDGRTSLEAALAGLDPAAATRARLGAANAIKKAMSTLLGYHADAMFVAIWVLPSEEKEDRCDLLLVTAKSGIRRFRKSAPITVFGRNLFAPHTGGWRYETIDGEPATEDVDTFLLANHCTQPLPRLNYVEMPRNVYLHTFDEDVPALNTPVTLVGAQFCRCTLSRYRQENKEWVWESVIPRIPCHTLNLRLYLHESVRLASEPMMTTTLHGFSAGMTRPDDPRFLLDRVGLSTSLERVRGTSDKPGVDDEYGELLAEVYDRGRLDPERFTEYRCLVKNPVPMVNYTMWLHVPEKPDNGSI